MPNVKLIGEPLEGRPKRTIQAGDVILNPTQADQITEALTAKDAAVVDATYGAEEQGVIDNNRTRIEEIESLLKDFGFLPA